MKDSAEIAWDNLKLVQYVQVMTNAARGFIRSEEAGQFIESITDPVTKILVNNAHYQLYRRLAEKRLPEGEFDMRFYVEVMAEMFSEHDVIRRMLAGENVGAFFD